MLTISANVSAQQMGERRYRAHSFTTKVCIPILIFMVPVIPE
jgi:hypothetical protein